MTVEPRKLGLRFTLATIAVPALALAAALVAYVRHGGSAGAPEEPVEPPVGSIVPIGRLVPSAEGEDSLVVVGEQLPEADRDKAVGLVLTGNVRATLQWCACETGMMFMAPKRVHLVRETVKDGRSLLVDAGEAFGGDTETDRSRAETWLSIMESLGYDAALPGPDAFAFGAEFVHKNLFQSSVPWVCANLRRESEGGGKGPRAIAVHEIG
ncbi:MAG: hypothetical protein RDV41_07605, partial [Planctomycetota bacterium]|nr:hypothetical protein [Planctomycetota bacterium]